MSMIDLHDDDLELDETDLEPREGETETDLVKRLRGQLKTQGKELKTLRPLKEKVAEIELGNNLKAAFDEEETKGLSEAKKTAVLAVAGDDKSPEALRKAAVELGYVEPRVDPLEQELEAHERVENAGAGARSSAATKLDGKTVGEWPMDKQLRFKAQHPDAWDQILRGEAVTGITF